VAGDRPRRPQRAARTQRRPSTRTSRPLSTLSARPPTVRPRDSTAALYLTDRLTPISSCASDAVPTSLIGKLHSGPAAGSSPVRTTTNTVPHQQASAPGAAHSTTTTTEDISNAVKDGAAGLQENARIAADKVAELGKSAYSESPLSARALVSPSGLLTSLCPQTPSLPSLPSTRLSPPATPRPATRPATATLDRPARPPRARSPASPTRPRSSPTPRMRRRAPRLRRPSSRRSRTSRPRLSTSSTSSST
jgi:hypothetical protein